MTTSKNTLLLLRYYIDLFESVSAEQPDFLKLAVIENHVDDFLLIPNFLADKLTNKSIEIYQDMPELAVSSGFSAHKNYANNFFIWLMASSGIEEFLLKSNLFTLGGAYRITYSDNKKVVIEIPIPQFMNRDMVDSVIPFFFSILMGILTTMLPEAVFYLSINFSKNNQNQFLESIPNCQVVFNADKNQVTIFHPDALHTPFVTTNAVFSDLLSTSSVIQELVLKPDITFNVHEIVKHSLHQTNLSINDIAHKLCLSPRTLQRRLKEKDQSFQDILHYERKSKAIELMKDKQIPRSTIVEMIGIQNLRSLYRIVGRS
jgi:AraC-like DNA-binding protein